MTGQPDRYKLVAKSLQLEEEVATLKQSMLQMSARMLRLELALSVLDKDGSLTSILTADKV